MGRRRLDQSSQSLAGTTSGYRANCKSPCHPTDHRRGKRQSQRQCCCRAQFRNPQTVTHEAITSSEKEKKKTLKYSAAQCQTCDAHVRSLSPWGRSTPGLPASCTLLPTSHLLPSKPSGSPHRVSSGLSVADVHRYSVTDCVRPDEKHVPAGFDRKLALRRGRAGDDLGYLRCACGLDEKQSGESAAWRL